MLHKINTLAIVAGFLFALASMSIDSFGQNAIVEIKDLVQEAHEAVWTDGNENSIDFGQTAGFYGAVLRGSKLGGPNGSFYSRTGELLVDETIRSDTIDIDFAPTLGRNASVVKGFYTIQLPVKKRIQLEMVYDLFLDAEGMRNPGELYVEVYEQNALNSDQWLKTGEMHQKESMKVPLGLERVNQIRESRFVTHHFVANLSHWAGREVQVALVAAIPDHAVTKQRARWCSARLMGCSFDWKFDVVPKGFRRNQSTTFSQKDSKSNRASIKLVTGISSSTEEINLTDAANPEASLSTEYIGGRWLGYFHALLDTNTGLTNIKRRGTTAFDMGIHDESYGPNLYTIDEISLENSVLRGTSAVSAATASSGTPFFLIKPVEPTAGGDNSDWRIGYTGMTTTVKENDQIHGFIHTEDWYQNGSTLNDYNSDDNRDYWYVRIGYARSSVGNGTDFTWMYDSSVGSPTPAIECFQPEWAYTFPLPPDQPRRTYGAAMPTIIKNTTGDYFYLFYTRFLDNSPSEDYAVAQGFQDATAYLQNVTATVGGFWDQICMARAPVNDVKSSNYSSQSNPWRKGFRPNNGEGNWEFTNAARVPDDATESASYSYPIIRDNYRCSPKVHYDAALEHYMMICKGAEGFYIYVTSDVDDLTSWGEGILLLEQAEDEELIHDPSLIGYTGSDKEGAMYYLLYYSYDKDATSGGHILARRDVWFDE